MTHATEALARPPLMFGLVSAAVIVAGLYFGRDLLMPLALAVLVGFVLDPIVTWLKRRGLPRVLAVVLVCGLALGLLAATTLFVFGQLRQIGNDLPIYEKNITLKLRTFGQSLRQPGVLDQYSRIVGKVERELDAVQRSAESHAPQAAQPTRVEVVRESVKPMQRMQAWLETFAVPLAMAGIVIVFVFLILLDRGDLRDRLLRLLGNNLHRNTDALNEAGRRVSKYLTMQLLVNATYGIPLALGLFLIGVPGALVWGLLGAVLRFVPYVGPIIAAIFPLTLAFAVDPGWDMVLWAVGLIVLLELISNNIIEPWLYGTSTGLSTLSLIVAAMFWTALWGPIGLVLSTPITVVLLVLGRHLPQLQFLEVLLGSAPALDEPTRMHQRLLAGDVDEAVELATEHAEASSPEDFYANVGLGTLRLASQAHDTVATAEHRHRVVSGIDRVLDEMHDLFPADVSGAPQAMFFGGRWAVDSLAAQMASHALALRGYHSTVAQVGIVSADFFAKLDLQGARLVCLSYFSPDPTTLAKYFIRRLRRRWPDVQVILAAWNASNDDEPRLREATGAEVVVNTLPELLAHAESLLTPHGEASFLPAPMPDDDTERVAALRASGLLEPALRGPLDAIARRAADVFDTHTAQVALIDADWRHVHGDAAETGRAEVAPPEQDEPRQLTMCGHVVAEGEPVVVPDIARDPRFAGNASLAAEGYRFYAGAPLRDRDGHVLGTLCLMDRIPHTLTPRDMLLLQNMADEVMKEARTLRAAPRATATGSPPPALAPG